MLKSSKHFSHLLLFGVNFLFNADHTLSGDVTGIGLFDYKTQEWVVVT